MIRKVKKNITHTKEIVHVLNDHYIISWNILRGNTYLTDDIKIVDYIIQHYEDHPCAQYK